MKMNSQVKCLFPFIFALITCPLFIILHECGHYAAAPCFGWEAKLHYAATAAAVPAGKPDSHTENLVIICGPLVNAVLAVTGFLWLRRLHAHRAGMVSTPGGWLATCLVLNTGRWLRGFNSTPSHPKPKDEALISQALGMPGWLLPFLLGLVAVTVLVAAVRLHPPGGRLLPFASPVTGGVAGVFLWMRLAGPFLLP